MRFRKKPVEIDAVRIRDLIDAVHNNGSAEIPDWATAAHRAQQLMVFPDGVIIKTLEGRMTATAETDDWLLRGVEGELYSCKGSIFAKTYEPVVDGEPSFEEKVRELHTISIYLEKPEFKAGGTLFDAVFRMEQALFQAEQKMRTLRAVHNESCLQANTGRNPWKCECATEERNAIIDAFLEQSVLFGCAGSMTDDKAPDYSAGGRAK